MDLRNIFSVSDYKNTHKLIKIFGIKIKVTKKKFAQKKKENPYYYYKKNSIDISTIPPAVGQMRMIQLANLELLKELDYVCRENNLTYWLDGGTLLGAVRHKGFIPWDDDIDTIMPRASYNKIIEAFEKSSRNSEIYAQYVADSACPATCFIKVMHKKCKYLFVDIFPLDIYGEKLTKDEQIARTVEIAQIRKTLVKDCEYDTDTNIIRTKILKYMNEIRQSKSDLSESDFVRAIDMAHTGKNYIHSYETFFPLKEISFEGLNFPCINDTNTYLTDVYGKNYMDYPPKIGMAHSAYLEIQEEEMDVLKDIIKDSHCAW
uniref:LicD/FKTN/FKRP nucleotidyltransferase domain-containing protein n=1 Tax=uncultured Candidatus Melainabacteria bacterium TaxID=2682970 RepID=A0A650EJA9_9BACT|nr:hypothetical protein Melaina855_1660 [uncultured Candidatus Melainabacteria bacterium]